MVVLPSIRRKYMNPRIPRGETVSMSECVVTLASDSVSYTGGTRTVGVTVTWNGEALSVNADYTLSFANNVNVGPATVTVTGLGQFSGSVTKTFYVVADGGGGSWTFDLSKSVFVSSASLSDNGSQIAGYYNLQLLQNGDLFFADSSTQRMYIWEWANGSPAASYKSRSDVVAYAQGAFMARNGLSVVYAGNPFYGTYARSLASAFDLSSISGGAVSVYGASRPVICLSADGKRLALKGGNNNEFHVFAMETAYDYGNMTAFSSYNMSNLESDIRAATGESSGSWYGFSFSDDGTGVVAVWGKCVLKLSMSVPWDVSTCTLESFFKPPQGSNWGAIAVSPSGDKMIIAGTSDNKTLYEYSLVA